MEFGGGGGRDALSSLLLPLSLLRVLRALLYCDCVTDCQAGADIFSDIFFSTCSADKVRYVTGSCVLCSVMLLAAAVRGSVRG